MSRKRKRGRTAERTTVATSDSTERQFRVLGLPLLAIIASFAALLVATPLVPGEGAADVGTGNLLAIGWLTLSSCVLALAALQPKMGLQTSWPLFAWLGLVVWHVVTTFVLRNEIHLRPAINMTYVWLGAGACVFVAIQLFRRDEVRTAVVALLIALGCSLALHGYHQYFVSMPRTAREYDESSEEEKRHLLQANNLDPTPGSADRKHFEDRLHATVPFATFGLANSLAGFLAPISVLALGVGWGEWRTRRSVARLATLVVLVLIMLGCLTLTQSRTSYLSFLVGVGALVYITGFTTRLDWRWVAIGAGVLMLLGCFGVAVGGLDIQVLSESSKSLQYRVEYWQGTSQMIAESPLLGCGPGQFQASYAKFKLAQASETIADPHNLLFEAAATVGLPGLLLLVLCGAFLLREYWTVARQPQSEEAETTNETVESLPFQSGITGAGIRTAVNVGGTMGVFVALAAGSMVEQTPDLWSAVALLVAFGLAAAWMWGDFEVPRSALAAALFCWAFNLLAAGGLTFPGVALVGWLLFSLLVVQGRKTRTRRLHQGGALGLLALNAVIVLAGMQLATRPLEARTVLNSPLMFNSYGDAQRLCAEAIAKDPFWADPWSRLAAVEHQKWLQTSDAAARKKFDSAVEKMLTRAPKSWSRRRQAAAWYLTAWRLAGDDVHLERAMRLYQEAQERYPNSIELNAQLAWVHHLRNDESAAREWAGRAIDIDAQHPHVEHKLNSIGIFDPGRLAFSSQPEGPTSPTAEPIMQRLRIETPTVSD